MSGGLRAGDVDVAFRKHTGSGAVHHQQQQGKAGTTARRPGDASSSSDKLLTFPNFLKVGRSCLLPRTSSSFDPRWDQGHEPAADAGGWGVWCCGRLCGTWPPGCTAS